MKPHQTRLRKYNGMIIFLIVLSGINCKEVYNPSSTRINPNFLVVDGVVISGNDSTIITLSRTKGLTDSAPTVKELNARVSVITVSGAEYPFIEQGKGRYVTDRLLLDPSLSYQLKIVTRDGDEFRSVPEKVHISPPIDSIYWVQDSVGVHEYLNTHDPGNNTRYYHWEYVETWEYLSAYNSFLEYIDENNIVFRGLSRQIYRCYQSRPSSIIEVTSTNRLSLDTVNKYEVTYVPKGSEKITALYSNLIKQYAITVEAFNYWTNLKKNTEQLGSLFDLQPFTELGNIQCLNNPASKCIGYINFSTLQKQRIFINKNEINDWNYHPYYDAYEPCQFLSASPYLISQFFLPPGGPYGNSMIGQGLDTLGNTVYFFSTKLCVDCTVHGGSTEKPLFWPN
jgi:Domain of unknown function (DUF4249)